MEKSKFVAIVCTEEADLNGNRFSKEAIADLVKQAIGLPVTAGFNKDIVLGNIEEARVTEKGVEVSVTLSMGFSDLKLYIVPGEVVEKFHVEGDVLVIDKVKMQSFGVTPYPADTRLIPIKKVE